MREATAEDAPALADLLGQLGYPTDARSLPERLTAYRDAGEGRVLVAVHDGRVVGFAALDFARPIQRAERIGHLSAFAVASDARRQGVGRILLAAVEDAAREAGCRHVHCTSAEHRAGAHLFYPAAGWPLTGRRFSRVL